MVRVDGELTDTHCYVTKALEMVTKKAVSFKSPSFVRIIQMRLTIMSNRISVRVYDNCGIVVFGRCRPSIRNIDLFRVGTYHDAIMLQCCCPSPDRGYPGTGWLEEWGDVAQRLEVVA